LREVTRYTEHNNPTTPAEEMAIMIAPELNDNDSSNVLILLGE
jgi:hypothetical protein